jgi:predicted dehydrogenase
VCLKEGHVAAAAVSTVRVALVGVHGHGRFHLNTIRRLSGRLGIQLAGICDRRPLTRELRALAGPVAVHESLADLLDTVAPDVTIIATPIHTHVGLALLALESGSHVLLEKPPAPTLAEYERLCRGVRRTGKACQIGFQSLGSQAAGAVRRLADAGTAGSVRGIGATGCWIRDESYYARAPWAGRRWLDGTPVTDGAVTNPFAHAVISALCVAGAEERGTITRIETDLYHAHDIEADDTSAVRLVTGRGVTITVAVTLCAVRETEPRVTVYGSGGRITLWYTRDEVRVQAAQADETIRHTRTDLLENLVAHVRDPGTELLVPVERAGSFMEVVEAVGRAPQPFPIPGRYQRIEGTGTARRRVVDGIDGAVEAAASGQRLFRELGLPWAR